MLAADLGHALNRGELELHHQAQFDSAGSCVGSEALLRWPHPVFGFVAPPLVVQLAEESKRLGELERWVFTEAGRHAAALRERGLPAKTCVNLTPSTLYDAAFLDHLRSKIAEGALRPEDLLIEITEQTSLLFTGRKLRPAQIIQGPRLSPGHRRLFHGPYLAQVSSGQ